MTTTLMLQHLDWGREFLASAFVDAKSLLTLCADVEGKRKQSLVDLLVVRHVLHLQSEYERNRKCRPHFYRAIFLHFYDDANIDIFLWNIRSGTCVHKSVE